MQAIWKRLYSQKSSRDKGTLYQLRTLTNRTSVPSDPSENMNAAEDFLLLVLHAQCVVAAKQILSETDKDEPLTIEDLSKAILHKFTYFKKIMPPTSCNSTKDEVQMYAIELLTLGLLWHGFHDAIREGDGERILRYWRFLLVVFKSTNHRNYAKEAVNLQLQYQYMFSDRQKEQLLCSRTVNTKGREGCNIPIDLHMEHLNRRLKIMLKNFGANISDSTIQKAGRCLSGVNAVCQAFEHHSSDHHPYPEFGKDLEMVMQVFEEENVFAYDEGRSYSTFKIKYGLMEKLKKSEVISKVKTTIENIYYV